MDLGHAVVTGAARGLGRAFATDLADRGWRVTLLDIDADGVRGVAASLPIPERHLALPVDVRRRDEVDAALERAAAELGPVDGLVNNAGIIRVARCGFDEIPEDEWDLVYDVHVKGAWHVTRAAVRHMRADGGSIVNLSSSMALKGGPLRAHYASSKAAVLGLTRVLARELGDRWIRVNAVTPGSTLTEDDPSEDVLTMRARAADLRALKRTQTPDDVVGAVAFLLGPESAFITGQNLVVEGGGILS